MYRTISKRSVKECAWVAFILCVMGVYVWLALAQTELAEAREQTNTINNKLNTYAFELSKLKELNTAGDVAIDKKFHSHITEVELLGNISFSTSNMYSVAQCNDSQANAHYLYYPPYNKVYGVTVAHLPCHGVAYFDLIPCAGIDLALSQSCPIPGYGVISTNLSVVPKAGLPVTVHGHTSRTSSLLYTGHFSSRAGGVLSGEHFKGNENAIYNPDSWFISGKQVQGLSGSSVLTRDGYGGTVHATAGFSTVGNQYEMYPRVITPQQVLNCIINTPTAGAFCPNHTLIAEPILRARILRSTTAEPESDDFSLQEQTRPTDQNGVELSGAEPLAPDAELSAAEPLAQDAAELSAAEPLAQDAAELSAAEPLAQDTAEFSAAEPLAQDEAGNRRTQALSSADGVGENYHKSHNGQADIAVPQPREYGSSHLSMSSDVPPRQCGSRFIVC